jgi:PAS domain S-box-containing protein
MHETATPATRILIIDDQEQTRYVFRRILNRAGYEVSEAATGGEGLQKAAQAPDLIIADVNLPDMLGYDLCRRLKSDPVTAGTPVLQISASFISDESKAQALQGGADSYLVQPVEPAVLLAQVTALLRLRKAESLSSMAARQWQTTFDSLNDGLALIGAQGTVLRTNRAFLSLFRISMSQVEGRQLSAFLEETFGVSLAAIEGQGGPAGAELQYGDRWLRVRSHEITDVNGEHGGSVLLATDITEHKKLQETLKMSERLAATGRLAHIIAHEINNPLEALANLLFLVEKEESLSRDSRDYLEQATQELGRISEITKQILAYHRQSRMPIPALPQEVLEGVLAMFRLRLIGTRVELRTSFGCTSPIAIHPGEIRQAVGNLISNALDAIDFVGQGTLRIGCVPCVDIPSGRRGVRMIISDTGPGIAEAMRDQVYDAFFTTKDTKGSGIGLWLTSEIISKHNGRMRLRSRTEGPYRGTLFDIFLPMS